MKTLKDFFINELKDLYNAELQIEKAVQEMEKKAHSKELKEALHKHHMETKELIRRLDKIATELTLDLSGGQCDEIKEILRHGHQILGMNFPSEITDAAIISSAQKVEHYEIAVYRTLKAFAQHLSLKNIQKLLDESSKEAGHADKILTDIASGILFKDELNKETMRKTA